MSTKFCSKCKTNKETTEFYKRSKATDGLQPWCKICSTSNKTDWIKENRDKTFWNRLWSRHRIRPQQLIDLLEEQNWRCKLQCGKELTIQTLHVDHNHSCCGKEKSCIKCRRGLLCQSCNHMVGWYEAMHGTELALRIERYLYAEYKAPSSNG